MKKLRQKSEVSALSYDWFKYLTNHIPATGFLSILLASARSFRKSADGVSALSEIFENLEFDWLKSKIPVNSRKFRSAFGPMNVKWGQKGHFFAQRGKVFYTKTFFIFFFGKHKVFLHLLQQDAFFFFRKGCKGFNGPPPFKWTVTDGSWSLRF